ncbi:MAG TPA: hypothetical protein PK147_10350 [Saprospiraceae bacterium]|nr:hypothetical protein [Saprospiraceae bacterium]MCB9328074.1 hypothetical protein [Lewinellaceae bacterium]HPK11045.1 hypothetical protein [Saprospiraceae bacterium]HPQ22243.1 hypothetical protein [Saprospiraceae bacterium]HRX28315.1 hypothetical protein [Saprospiraceae bacterium]
MSNNKNKKKQADLHDDLKGFDIRINEFGELVSNFKIEKLNDFLDKQSSQKNKNEEE